MDLTYKTYTKNPPWMFFSIQHKCDSLSSFLKCSLLEMLKSLQLNIVTTHICRTVLIEIIVKLFENRCIELAIKSDSELLNICHTIFLIVKQQFRSVILANILNNEYGNQLFNNLCKPSDSVGYKIHRQLQNTFLQLDKKLLISCQILSSASIKEIFMQIHPSERPLVENKFKDLSLTLTLVFYKCERILCQYSERPLAKLLFCHCPFNTMFKSSWESMVLDILHYEFGEVAYGFFTQKYYNFYCAQSISKTCGFAKNNLFDQSG